MLRQIRYFQTVARLGSFSKAAEECYISQSAVSQQVKALERELGVTLLRREGRSFTLTPAGRCFYQKSLVLMADFERLVSETKRIDQGNDFTLRVGYLKGYGGGELQRAAAEFAALYPDVPVETRGGAHEELYDMLRDGSVDLALSDQRRAFSGEYVNTVLTVTDCQIEISARDPTARLASVDAADLRRTPCILVAPPDQWENERAHYREIYGIGSDFLFAENLEEARLMVVSGRGFLPIEGGVLPGQYAGMAVRLSLTRGGRPIRVNLCAFWREDNSGAYVEKFAKALKEQFPE